MLGVTVIILILLNEPLEGFSKAASTPNFLSLANFINFMGLTYKKQELQDIFAGKISNVRSSQGGPGIMIFFQLGGQEGRPYSCPGPYLRVAELSSMETSNKAFLQRDA